MKVVALIPVFNRLELTIKCVESLLNQRFDGELHIVIIDDGSSDGTDEYFSNYNEKLSCIRGDGNLWWGGAINLGLRFIKNKLTSNDYVLFVNNDTILEQDCIFELIKTSSNNAGAIVGGVIYDINNRNLLLDLGPKANLENFHIFDIKNTLNVSNNTYKAQYDVDFLSGRGVLYPADVILSNGLLSSFFLPHYHSDYEYSYRCSKKMKRKLMVCTCAKVYSTEKFSVENEYKSRFTKYFSNKSIHNLLRRYIFFAMVGSVSQRIIAPFRLIYGDVVFFRKKLSSKINNVYNKYKPIKSRNKECHIKIPFREHNNIELISNDILESRSLAPVILFTYNRPVHTKKTVESLMNNVLSERTDLIVFSDGAKCEEDIVAINDIRAYIKKCKGFRAIKLVSRDNNIGLAKNIIDGVTEIINEYGHVIVLEDDMEVSADFLNFMNKCLINYKNEKSIWHIAAWNEDVFGDYDTEIDAICWRFMNCWGWATWKDRWEHFEKKPNKLIADFNDADIYKFNLNGANNFWAQVVNNANGQINTWAIFWYAVIFKNDGLCINAFNSLVKNIGLDGTGVHCGEMKLAQNLIVKERVNFPKYPVENVSAMKILIDNYLGYK